ncbi:type II secretion system F family protein [Methylobacterium sp. J-090]|uniref:type II secretion system F family protein n=1 Tax=Methylobacterium sp. J-090 TaxID=2836666 RepID=UPI001FBBC5A8|nr:type II secretion system F family protein [Methylobacterium sp. J-090]MCJ2082589.1 type II secretion system F family protein [Methylobacterium sp. J-090]
MSVVLLVTVLAFASVALALYTATSALSRRERVRRRYGGLGAPAATAEEVERDQESWLDIDPARLGLDVDARRALRRELIRSGFFAPSAVVIFTLARLGLRVGLPTLGTLVVTRFLPSSGLAEAALIALVLFIVAHYLPRAYLSRRQRHLEIRYRAVFPNFLDMLVVCINAGLSLDAALDRASGEIGASDAEFRANFDLMAGEMRAGKSTPEALKACAERLGLPEARSFAALLQQTIELGTDVSLALTTFSDEMRDRRMSRAEEKAASLPPKLTLPLGLFIFPVVLIVILAPAVMKVLRATAP